MSDDKTKLDIVMVDRYDFGVEGCLIDGNKVLWEHCSSSKEGLINDLLARPSRIEKLKSLYPNGYELRNIKTSNAYIIDKGKIIGH